MIFALNEVIYLANNEKYIVVDSLKENDIWYYYLCEVTLDELKVKKNFKIITTVKDNNNILVKTIKDELKDRLEKQFKERLNI